MAKRKINKTQIVKKALANDSKASPKEISKKLAKKGITVSPNYVSNIKTTSKKKTKKKGRPKKVAATDKISLASLVEVKKLANRLGGIDKAQEALNALAKLQ